jgi:FkbM family methyltransferase
VLPEAISPAEARLGPEGKSTASWHREEILMRDRLEKLGQLLLNPRGLAASLRWKPFSLTSFGILTTLKQCGLEFRTIIDAGANIGQFARASIETFPDADVFSIEPLPRIVARLRANLADRPRVQVFQTALGGREGKTRFYPHRYDQISSALPLRADQTAYGKGLRHSEAIEVPMTRLDTLFSNRSLRGPVLLKLDLQGFELEALKGAVNTIRQCDSIITETVFENVYEGEPLFGELQEFLARNQFRFTRPLGFNRKSDGLIFEMDALFQREPARASEGRWQMPEDRGPMPEDPGPRRFRTPELAPLLDPLSSLIGPLRSVIRHLPSRVPHPETRALSGIRIR